MDACKQTKGRMASYLSGRLHEAARRETEAHIGACRTCGGEMEMLKQAWAALDGLEETAPCPGLRDKVLGAVAAARENEARETPSGKAMLRMLIPALAAVLASLLLLVGSESACRSAVATACCGALWAGVYMVGFAVIAGSRRRTPIRRLTIRGLAAGAAGLLLARFCPIEGGGQFSIPLLSDLAASSPASPWAAFALGLLLALPPLSVAILAAPLPAGTTKLTDGLTEAGTYFGLVAPGLYLLSGTLALAGLFALLLGAAIGSLIPALIEVTLHKYAAEAA